jgi:hydrogenase nickel incorporation protein HypA/HybF
MHEHGIADQMVKLALDYAARHHAARIARFNLEMSSLVDESEDSLRFHLESLTRGTIAQDATIEIHRAVARRKCLVCAAEFESSTSQSGCPKCQGTRSRPIPQDEFRLVSIDVE